MSATVAIEAVATRTPTTCAASWLLREMLTTDRTLTVIAVGPCVIYAQLDDVAVDDRVADTPYAPSLLAISTIDAVRMPFTVVSPARATDQPWSHVLTADQIRIRERRVGLRDLSLDVRRWWHPRTVEPPSDEQTHLDPAIVDSVRSTIASAARTVFPLPDLDLLVAADRLATAIRIAPTPDKACNQLVDLVASLVGAGSGATPTGDDLLAGLLLGLRGFVPREARFWSVVANAMSAVPLRTNALSAELLRCAMAGHGIDAATDLVRALRSGDADTKYRTGALLTIGHESGVALAAGVLTAARIAMSAA